MGLEYLLYYTFIIVLYNSSTIVLSNFLDTKYLL